MKQHLRSFLTLLMLVVWASGFAADKTYSYTFASNVFTSESETKSLNKIDWTLSAERMISNKEIHFGSDKNKGQQFGSSKKPVKTATFTTSGITGTIKSISVVAWNASTDSKTSLKVSVNGVSYGDETPLAGSSSNATSPNTKYTFNGNSKGEIKLIFTNNGSKGGFWFNTISVTYEDGPTKTPTTLTFQKSIFNIEEGNETTFTGQTATLKTGETELNNAITYTTSNDAMFETYDAKVGPKTLKTGEYGTAVVTATFAGDATYAASTATYTVNYTEKAKPATTLNFGFATKTANINETFTATATLKAGETAISGAVTYTSSNHKVATVNETTGEVSALTAGITTIKATFAGTSEYKGSSASYELTVNDPNAIETTFDFTKPENYDYGVSSGNDNHEGDLDDNGGQIISNGVVITSTSTNSAPNRFWKNGLRVYKDSKLVVSASGYKITKITTEGGVFDWTYNYDGTAVYNYNASATLTSMTVTMSPLPQVTFTENENNDDALIINDKGTVNATLTRTLVANKWNTFCVPFETEIDGTALEGATIKAVGEVVGNVINLVDADKIEAGVPYLVMPTTGDIVNPTFKNVTISVTTPIEAGNDEYKFVGTYSPKKINEDEFGKIWGVTAEGKLAKIKANTTMKGLRAYFVFLTNTAAAKLNFDGETTGINNIETEATVNGKVYNLNGQYVGNSLNGLKKGIYVVNGKKVIK